MDLQHENPEPMEISSRKPRFCFSRVDALFQRHYDMGPFEIASGNFLQIEIHLYHTVLCIIQIIYHMFRQCLHGFREPTSLSWLVFAAIHPNRCGHTCERPNV